MGGSVQNRSSTHLNICAAFSALKRPKEVGCMLSFAVCCRQQGAQPMLHISTVPAGLQLDPDKCQPATYSSSQPLSASACRR